MKHKPGFRRVKQGMEIIQVKFQRRCCRGGTRKKGRLKNAPDFGISLDYKKKKS